MSNKNLVIAMPNSTNRRDSAQRILSTEVESTLASKEKKNMQSCGTVPKIYPKDDL